MRQTCIQDDALYTWPIRVADVVAVRVDLELGAAVLVHARAAHGVGAAITCIWHSITVGVGLGRASIYCIKITAMVASSVSNTRDRGIPGRLQLYTCAFGHIK